MGAILVDGYANHHMNTCISKDWSGSYQHRYAYINALFYQVMFTRESKRELMILISTEYSTCITLCQTKLNFVNIQIFVYWLIDFNGMSICLGYFMPGSLAIVHIVRSYFHFL